MDYSTILTDEERQEIFSYPYTNKYPLTNEQCQFLDDEGYLVIKKLYDEDICDTLVREMFQSGKKYFNLDRDDPDTWNIIPSYGMLNVFHLPSHYVMRQNEMLYSIFAQLTRTHKLIVSMDRVSMKSPCLKPQVINGSMKPNDTLQLHTDINYWHSDPKYAQFQCGVCLDDCDETCGGFFCLPRAHKSERILQYKEDCMNGKFGKFKLPPQNKVFIYYSDTEALSREKITIPLEKGDIVIWNNNLPHAGGINCNPGRWRLQAFIRFLALDGPSISDVDININNNYVNLVHMSVLNGRTPARFPTGNKIPKNVCNELEMVGYRPPKLTPLGKKVLGDESWD